MTGHNIGNEEYTVCFRSGLQEWKAVLAGHTGVWVTQPYKDIVEAMVIPALHKHIHQCGCVHVWCGGWWCQLGSLKIVPSGGLQLHGTLRTHDRKSSKSQQISLSFVMSAETKRMIIKPSYVLGFISALFLQS